MSDLLGCWTIALSERGEPAGGGCRTTGSGSFRAESSGVSAISWSMPSSSRAHGPLSKAVASATPGQATPSDAVTVTGKVADAACFMLHAPAATAASHKDCGAACLARGVPPAIATDDGVLYFPADGNRRLKSSLNARVRASGTVVAKHDPMELKMPVGDNNQMVVRVEGGYKQITIQTLEKISPANRRAS